MPIITAPLARVVSRLAGKGVLHGRLVLLRLVLVVDSGESESVV